MSPPPSDNDIINEEETLDSNLRNPRLSDLVCRLVVGSASLLRSGPGFLCPASGQGTKLVSGCPGNKAPGEIQGRSWPASRALAAAAEVHIAEVMQIFFCVCVGLPVMRTPLQALTSVRAESDPDPWGEGLRKFLQQGVFGGFFRSFLR